MGKAWGFHLMLNVGKCRPDTIRCARNIEQFTKQLVRDIDMTAFGEPQIVMFGTGDKKGYTLIQLIETSNICAHFCEETNDFYLDVFSCKPFHKIDVISCVSKHFHPETVNEHYVERLA
jgi:S-adenosylmethionine/arginine decarboxylase-like enzyme